MAYFNPNQPIVQSSLTLAPTHLNTQIAKGVLDIMTAKEANDRANAELAMMQDLHPGELEFQDIRNKTAKTRLDYLPDELYLTNTGKDIANKQAQFNFEIGEEDRNLVKAANNLFTGYGKGMDEQLALFGLDRSDAGTIQELVNTMKLANQRGSTEKGFDLSRFNTLFANALGNRENNAANATTEIEQAMSANKQVDTSLTPDPNMYIPSEDTNRLFAGKNGMKFYVQDGISDEDLKAFDKANDTKITDLKEYSYNEIHPRNRDKQTLGSQGTFVIKKSGDDIVIEPVKQNYVAPNTAIGKNLDTLANDPKWDDNLFAEQGKLSPKKAMVINNYHELSKASYGTSRDGKDLTLSSYFKTIANDDEKSLVAASLMSLLNMGSSSNTGLNLQNPKLAKAIHSLIENGKDVSKGKLDNELRVFGSEADLNLFVKDLRLYITSVLDTLNKKDNAINFARDENNVRDKDGNKYPYLQQKHFKAINATYKALKRKEDNKAIDYNNKQIKYKTKSEADKYNTKNKILLIL